MFLTTVVPIIPRTVVGSALCVRRSPDCALCGPRGTTWGRGVGMEGEGLIPKHIFPSQDAPAFFIHPTKPPLITMHGRPYESRSDEVDGGWG